MLIYCTSGRVNTEIGSKVFLTFIEEILVSVHHLSVETLILRFWAKRLADLLEAVFHTTTCASETRLPFESPDAKLLDKS